jgi:hypothetical protein
VNPPTNKNETSELKAGTAVGFGWSLPKEKLEGAKKHATRADLALVLGTWRDYISSNLTNKQRVEHAR